MLSSNQNQDTMTTQTERKLTQAELGIEVTKMARWLFKDLTASKKMTVVNALTRQTEKALKKALKTGKSKPLDPTGKIWYVPAESSVPADQAGLGKEVLHITTYMFNALTPRKQMTVIKRLRKVAKGTKTKCNKFSKVAKVPAAAPAPVPAAAPAPAPKPEPAIDCTKRRHCNKCGYKTYPARYHLTICEECAHDKFHTCRVCERDCTDPDDENSTRKSCVLCDECCEERFPGTHCPNPRCRMPWYDGDDLVQADPYDSEEYSDLEECCEDCTCGSCGGPKKYCNGCSY